MLKQRTLALLLAGSIALALGTTIVAADPGETAAAPAPTQAVEAAGEETLIIKETPVALPDEAGTLSFANLASRMREKNINILALQEAIDAIGVLDYDQMLEDARDGVNLVADMQWGMISGMSMIPGLGNMMASSMQGSYDAAKKSFEAIRDGEMKADNDAMVRQWRNGQDQLIMAGESLYTGLLSAEYKKGELERQLAALDRQIQVAELSYQHGNVSALALQEAKAGRTALTSGLETMDMSIKTAKMQMESLIGEELTGAIRLQSVPQITAEQIAAMNLEADFAAAKEASYELFAAKRTLDDAEESFKDAKEDYSSTDYMFLSAKHQWQAAQYTYQGTMESFELKFRTLYLQVKDCYQIWEAAKVALEAEEAGYAADELKFSQGRISQNALYDAQDALATAREKVATTGLNLFTSYNNYRWAVDHGILN